MFFNKKRASKTLEQLMVEKVCEYFSFTRQELVTISSVEKGQFQIKLPFAMATHNKFLSDKLNALKADTELNIDIGANIPIFNTQHSPTTNVKNMIAVASGKGGVGKSATAVNLALGLKKQGARVGILDADIYGPSIPTMLDQQSASPETKDNKIMEPVFAHQIPSNSIGYLVKNDHASIWRGPMASKAITQLLKETRWPMLDYLIVDMPPGTGDIQLTVCQNLPLTAAVVVTTPQDIALNDAAKGLAMFDKLNVPVMGLIENMSYFECGNCHHKTAIFAEEGAQKLADKYQLPVLAQLPLDPIIREFADAGKSLLDEQAEHKISKLYTEAALQLSKELAQNLDVLPVAANMANHINVTKLE